MPRKVRIEFEGALYHIMCRGNRREEIFRDEQDRELFLSTLGQVCERCGFLVHSYVLMRNHYHLLLETPAGNLVAGMKWFQGTYTVRFNARHRLDGHLFAGRYKAVLVEREEPSYGRVVSDYIHLNPARAGLVNEENPRLGSFRWSSFPRFCERGKLPPWLRADDVYSWHRLDWRRARDRKTYGHYLEKRAKELWEVASSSRARQEATLLKGLRRGWVLGGEEFRDRMSDLASGIVRSRKRESYSGEEVRRYDKTAARELLARGLDALGIDLAAMKLLRPSDPRKQALAWLIRTKSIVDGSWITRELDMGHPSNVSRAVNVFRIANQQKIKNLKRQLLVCKD